MLAFLKKNKKNQEKNKAVANFSLSGIHCNSCTMLIENDLEDLEGVFESQANYASATARVVYDPGKLKVEDLLASIQKSGYQAKFIEA